MKNETLIFLKIVPLAFNTPMSFLLVNALLKLKI